MALRRGDNGAGQRIRHHVHVTGVSGRSVYAYSTLPSLRINRGLQSQNVVDDEHGDLGQVGVGCGQALKCCDVISCPISKAPKTQAG